MSSQWTDVESPAGLGKLNSHLSQNSYITGSTPSQDDLTVIALFGGNTPDEATYPHVARWFNHIKSFGDDHSSFGPAEEEDVDLFGDETEEEKLANEKRAQELASQQKKKVVIGKSSVILDIKPYDGETDLDVLEEKVRQIAMEGLEWKGSQRIEMAFGVKKLQIICNIIDDLVSIDADVIPKIEDFEDEVQSVDIFAFNKL